MQKSIKQSEILAKIDAIISNDSFTKNQKTEKLFRLREDCRAIQRAATEGGMTADDSMAADLSEIDRALAKLGVDPLQAEDKSAATL